VAPEHLPPHTFAQAPPFAVAGRPRVGGRRLDSGYQAVQWRFRVAVCDG